MKEKTKNILLIVLVFGLVAMTVAYAALTQVLNINAGAKVLNKSASWNVHFENLSSPTLNGYATIQSPLTLSGTTTLTGLVVNLRAPGDYAEYTFDVKNDGTINAKVNQISLPIVANATYSGATSDVNIVKPNIEYSLKYSDGTAIGQNDSLASGAHVTLKLHIGYSSSATTLPEADVTITGLDAHIEYIQAANN